MRRHLNTSDPEGLYQKVLNLNLEALDQRYGGDQPSSRDGYKYDPYTDARNNRYSELKRIRCYLYQCFEGSVPKTNLYKEIDRVANHLAYDIVSDLPEYENSKVWA